MTSEQQILMSLPEKFSRKEWLDEISRKTAFSYSHANRLLDSAVFNGEIERVNRGEYRKVEHELELQN